MTGQKCFIYLQQMEIKTAALITIREGYFWIKLEVRGARKGNRPNKFDPSSSVVGEKGYADRRPYGRT